MLFNQVSTLINWHPSVDRTDLGRGLWLWAVKNELRFMKSRICWGWVIEDCSSWGNGVEVYYSGGIRQCEWWDGNAWVLERWSQRPRDGERGWGPDFTENGWQPCVIPATLWCWTSHGVQQLNVCSLPAFILHNQVRPNAVYMILFIFVDRNAFDIKRSGENNFHFFIHFESTYLLIFSDIL